MNNLKKNQEIKPGLLVLNDMHITLRGDYYHEVDSSSKFCEVLNLLCDQEKPHMIVLNGDFCARDPDIRIYQQTADILRQTGIPVLAIPGNHDDPGLMEKILPLPAREMDAAGATNIMVHPDDPYCGWSELMGCNIIWINSWNTTVSSQQLDWLSDIRSEISANKPSIVFIHHPPAAVPARFMEYHFPLLNRDVIFKEIMKLPGLQRIFCGHYHRSYESIDPAVPLSMVTSSLYSMDPDSSVHRIDNFNAGYARIYLGETIDWTVAELPENMLQNQHAI